MTPGRRTFLVTGARAPGTLDIIRRLGRAGHDVLAADSARVPLGRFSRYARRYFHVPGPRVDPAGFVAALRRIVLAEKVDLLLPTCEEIYYVSQGRAELAGECEVFCAGLDVLETLHNKERFARLTHALGGPVTAPESVLVEDAACLRALARESREWVFKPVYSRFAARTLICPSPACLARVSPDSDNPWMAQRFVVGREVSSYSIAVHGRLTAHALYHSRHRAGQAAGVYFVAEENAAVLGFVERLVAHLGFTGQIGFDFIACGVTDRVFVLECNPRMTSGIHLFGPDFDLEGALRGAAGSLATVPVGDRPKMLGAAMMLRGFGGGLRASWAGAWWRDFTGGDDVVFARDDRLPALGQLASLAEMGGRGLRRRMKLTAAMTADIEWNGQPLP